VLVIEVCFLVLSQSTAAIVSDCQDHRSPLCDLIPARSRPASTAPTRHSPAGIRGQGLARLGRDEAFDKIKRDLRHLLPAVVDRERVAAVRDRLGDYSMTSPLHRSASESTRIKDAWASFHPHRKDVSLKLLPFPCSRPVTARPDAVSFAVG
jgi:hypothetical protein